MGNVPPTEDDDEADEHFTPIPVYVSGDVPCENPDEETVPTWPPMKRLSPPKP
jgi:hypothetical protein